MSKEELKVKAKGLLLDIENLCLKVEVLKKSQVLVHQVSKTRKEQIKLIYELKPTYDLQFFLSVFEIPSSTYYYHINRLKAGDKDKDHKELGIENI